MPDVHSRFLRNTMDDQRATTDSIGTVAIWGLGFAPILTIYYALRGEIFPRAANQRKDKSGGLPFQGTSNTPFVKNNLRGVYTECFQWLKGYNINSSSLGISSRTSNNASIALPSLIVTDHTFGVDAVSSCDNMNTDTEALLPTCVDVPGMLTSATSSSVVVDELGDETKGLPSDVDPANTSRRMRNRSFLRKHSNLTMSTDEGIDMDSEHDIFSSKDSGPDDSPTEPSSSGSGGFPLPNDDGEDITHQLESLLSRNKEEFATLFQGRNCDAGDMPGTPGSGDYLDVPGDGTTLSQSSLSYEDELEYEDEMELFKSKDYELEDELQRISLNDRGNAGQQDIVPGTNEEFEPYNEWSEFLHIVTVSGERRDGDTVDGGLGKPTERTGFTQNRLHEQNEGDDDSFAVELKDETTNEKTLLLKEQSETVETRLFAAIEGGDIDEARKLIREAKLLFYIDGMTVLHQVAMYNMAGVVPALFYFSDFSQLMDVAVRNPASRFHGYSAIRIAENMSHNKVIESINQYIEVEQSLTDLHRAVRGGHMNMIKKLCKAGALVNARAKKHITPLYLACTIGRLDIIKLLAGFGGNLRGKTEQGDSLLHRAAQLGFVGIAEFLLTRRYDYVDIDCQNVNNETALHKATLQGNSEMVEYLLQRGASPNIKDDCVYTPLHIVACGGDADVAQHLLRYGAIVDACDADNWTPLHCACKYGNLEIEELLLQKKASVFAETKGLNNTPLHIAVENGNCKIAENLIETGANVEARNLYGHTPLHISAIMDNLNMAELLVANGADVDSMDPGQTKIKSKPRRLYPMGNVVVQIESVQKIAEIYYSATPLHFASKHGGMSVVLFLIEKAADVDAKDQHGKTPLHYAAESGQLNVVETLIDHAATIDATDNRCGTPLHYASVNGHVAIVELLLSVGASVQATTERRHTALHCAANKGHVSIVEKLVQKGAGATDVDVYNWTPLHWAAAKEQQRTLEMLIEKGANVNGGTAGMTPLHIACAHGYLPTVEQLIASGSNVNAKDKDGWSALHHAANEGNLALVKFLIRKGALVGEIDNDGKTPLHCACMNGSEYVVDYLLTRGVDVNSLDRFRRSPLHVAAGEGQTDVIQLLINDGADVNAFDDEDLTPLHEAAKYGKTGAVDILIISGAVIHAPDADNWTALHYAAYNGHTDVITALVKHGANVESITSYRATALHLAAMRSHPSAVECLMANRAIVDQKNQACSTPLILATRAGSSAIVRKLIKNGASVNARDSKKRTSLHYAAEKGHEVIVNILLNHEADASIRDSNCETALNLSMKYDRKDISGLLADASYRSSICACSVQ